MAVVVATAALAASGSAGASVLLGVRGDASRFDAQTGQSSSIRHDVAGDDLYDAGHGATWAAATSLYEAHPSKPFAFAEWGLWGLDDPQFVRDMASWVHAHTRVEFLAYFARRTGSVWDLASKPRSRAAYRALITPLG